MEIIVKQAVSLEELIDRSWQGARDTWRYLQKENLMDIAEEILSEIATDNPDGIDEYSLNDYIWFELAEECERRAEGREENA